MYYEDDDDYYNFKILICVWMYVVFTYQSKN